MLRKIVTWFPVVVLLGGVANHFWHVNRHQLGPWLGAGFGMFSTTDVDSARQVFVTAIMADGREHPITLFEHMDYTRRRARVLPTTERFSALAERIVEDFAEGGWDIDVSAVVALRIEVWRSSYEPETLRPIQQLLVRRSIPLKSNDS